jgi:CheY-like chemotaxis protein
MNPWDYAVIVVEDEPDEVFLLKQAFQRAGVKNPLLVLRDGQDAIDYLSRPGAASGPGAPPALMLLDLKMPRRTGFEVLEWLRAQPGLSRLIVVVMAISTNPSDVNRAYELGCNSYLLKPGNPEQLVEMVRLINSYWLLLSEKPDLHPRAPFQAS